MGKLISGNRLIPLAGSRWVVANGDGEPDFGGQRLKLALPQSNPRAIATAAIGRDQQASSPWITRSPHGSPPSANAFDGKL
jgi:hypothetical protein